MTLGHVTLNDLAMTYYVFLCKNVFSASVWLFSFAWFSEITEVSDKNVAQGLYSFHDMKLIGLRIFAGVICR